MSSALIVLSGATVWTQKDGTQRPTGFWAEELVEPHRTFSEAGVELTIATPGGRTAVADEGSLSPQVNGDDPERVAELRSYLDGLAPVLSSPQRLEDVDPADFDAVVIPGGHGPMQDLAVDPEVGRVLAAALPDPDKTVAAICHGPASFLAAGDADGWLFAGRKLTAFTDEEETQTGLAANAPWLLETRLRDAGADFIGGPAWGPHVIVDGNLITGQNPASAKPAAEAVLERLGVAAGA
jgi:putative intracellular protease/amidase